MEQRGAITSSGTTSSSPASTRLGRVVIRFAGDSGDGIQLVGDRFTELSAVFGNDLATLPTKEVLIAEFVGMLQGPVANLVGLLQGTLQEFTGLIDARAEQVGSA